MRTRVVRGAFFQSVSNLVTIEIKISTLRSMELEEVEKTIPSRGSSAEISKLGISSPARLPIPGERNVNNCSESEWRADQVDRIAYASAFRSFRPLARRATLFPFTVDQRNVSRTRSFLYGWRIATQHLIRIYRLADFPRKNPRRCR